MAMQTSGFQTWDPAVNSFIEDERTKLPTPVYEKLFGVETTNRLQIRDVGITAPGALRAVGEMQDALDDVALNGYEFTYNKQNYRKSITFSSNLLNTDVSDDSAIQKLARSLPRVVPYSRSLHSLSTYRMAFDGSRLYGDGKRFVSLTHPRKDGGTSQANTFADGLQRPLTYDNVVLGEDVLQSIVAHNGTLSDIAGEKSNKIILTSMPNRVKAFQIAGVNGPDKEPNALTNNMNYFRKGTNYDVIVTKFLGWEAARDAGETEVAKSSASNYWDSMWFLLDADMLPEFAKFFIQDGYEKYATKEVEENESMKKFVYDMYAFGLTSYEFGFGSKGDNTTYAS